MTEEEAKEGIKRRVRKDVEEDIAKEERGERFACIKSPENTVNTLLEKGRWNVKVR